MIHKWSPNTTQMASGRHITVLSCCCSITVLHTCENTPMWRLSTQRVEWCSKANLKWLFCCWCWGQWWEPTLKLLHIHVQRIHLPRNDDFSWCDAEETRGSEPPKSEPPSLWGGPSGGLWHRWLGRQLTFPFSERSSDMRPQNIQAQVIRSSPLAIVIKTTQSTEIVGWHNIKTRVRILIFSKPLNWFYRKQIFNKAVYTKLFLILWDADKEK